MVNRKNKDLGWEFQKKGHVLDKGLMSYDSWSHGHNSLNYVSQLVQLTLY